MDDCRFGGAVTDGATRLPTFSHANVAAAEAFIKGKKLCRVVRLTGDYGKHGQIAAANRAQQRIARRRRHFARLQHARNHNRRCYYHHYSDSSNCRTRTNDQPHNWPPRSKDTTNLINDSQGVTSGPRGLKPTSLVALSGTAGAVPYPKQALTQIIGQSETVQARLYTDFSAACEAVPFPKPTQNHL